MKLSEHFTLDEMCKTSANLDNVPNEAQVENLKRLCGWLEKLRRRYNLRYVYGKMERSVSPPELGGARGGLRSAEGRLLPEGRKNEGMSGASSDHPAHTGTPPNLGGEKITPIIINRLCHHPARHQ